MIRNGKESRSRAYSLREGSLYSISLDGCAVTNTLLQPCGGDRNTCKCRVFSLGLYQYRTNVSDWSILVAIHSRGCYTSTALWQGTIRYSPTPSRCSRIDKRDENPLAIFFLHQLHSHFSLTSPAFQFSIHFSGAGRIKFLLHFNLLNHFIISHFF